MMRTSCIWCFVHTVVCFDFVLAEEEHSIKLDGAHITFLFSFYLACHFESYTDVALLMQSCKKSCIYINVL